METQTEKLKKQEKKRDFFCVVSDAFRVFARHSAIALGSAWQNTQNRDAKAVHLKLDELIRALKDARNELVDLEDLSDEELKKLEKQFQSMRKRAENDGGPSRHAEPAELR